MFAPNTLDVKVSYGGGEMWEYMAQVARPVIGSAQRPHLQDPQAPQVSRDGEEAQGGHTSFVIHI